MTKSGTVSGGLLGGSNLKSDMYPAFATYLVDITRHLREAEGVPIGWISPINEPQWPWLQI
jgi:O-glycosyl hydrolase